MSMFTLNLCSFRRTRSALLVSSACFFAASAHAATLTFDADPNTSGAQSGSGNWHASNTWWDGSGNVTWTDGNDVIIPSGSTVTVNQTADSSNVSLNGTVIVGDIPWIIRGTTNGSGLVRMDLPKRATEGNGLVFETGIATSFAWDIRAVSDFNKGIHVVARGNGTEVTTNGFWDHTGGGNDARISALEGATFIFGPNARVNNQLSDWNARFFALSSDGTGKFVFDPAFDVDLGGTQANPIGGLSVYHLINSVVESQSSQNLPQIWKGAAGSIKHHGGVKLREGNPTLIISNEPHFFDGGFAWATDWTLDTQVDLTHTEEGIYESNLDDGFGPESGATENTSMTKTGPAKLILKGDHAYTPGSRYLINEGVIEMHTNPNYSGDHPNSSPNIGSYLQIEASETGKLHLMPESSETFGLASISLANSSKLQLEGGKTQLTGDLVSASSSTVAFEYAPESLSEPMLESSGDVTLDGTVVISEPAESTFTAGTYPLIGYSTLSSLSASVDASELAMSRDAGFSATLQDSSAEKRIDLVLASAPAGTTFNMNNNNGDFVEITNDDLNYDTYIFEKTIKQYRSDLLTTGVHYTGGQSLQSNSNFDIFNLQGSPIVGVNGQGTVLNYSGEWVANGGQSKTSLVLQNGGHFIFTQESRLKVLLEDSFFTRQLWVLGDGTGTLEFEEGFVADRSQNGTVADGAGAYRLSNTTLITHHTQSLPVTPRPDGSGGLQTNGHLVFENEGGSTWITRTNAQEYPAAVWIGVDTTFQTETDLVHSGTTQFSSHFGSYWADNAFQTTQQNLTLAKTGAGDLTFAAETAFIEGTIFNVEEGGLIFQTDPASGARKGSSNNTEGGPNLQLVVGSGGVDGRNASIRFEAPLSRIESIVSTQGRIEVIGEVQMTSYASNSQKDLPNNVSPPSNATIPTTLNFHLDTDHGKLVVSGDAALGGELLFTREPGYEPPIGTSFDVLTAGSFSSGPNNNRAEFESVQDRSGLGLKIEYLSGRIRATTTREASTTAMVINEDWTDGAFDAVDWKVENSKGAIRNTGRSDPALALSHELSDTGFVWGVRSLDVPGFYVSDDDVLVIGMTTFSDVAYNNQESSKPEVACLNNNYLADFGHDHATELSRKYFTQNSSFQLNPSVENDDNKQLAGVHHSGGSTPITLQSADRSLSLFRPTASGANSEGFGEIGWAETNHTRSLQHFNNILISLPREFNSNRSPVFRTGTNQGNGQIGMSRAHVGVTKRTDANLDYATDAIDFIYWNSYRGSNSGMHLQWGDFDNDGDADGDDMALWQTFAGQEHDPNFNLPQSKYAVGDLPGSGTAPTFRYNASTGIMTIQTNGSNISAWAIEGSAALSTPTGGNWWNSHTAGKQQAADLSLAGLSGTVEIATFASGLNESSFGTVTYGYANGGGGETIVDITEDVASEYDFWADTYGLTGDQRLPDATPANDGISNLVKYGLGLNPTVPSVIPDLLEIVEEAGKEYLGIQFTRPENQSDLTTDGEATNNLDDWNAGALGVSVTTSSNGDGTETVTIRSLTPMDEEPTMFIRALFNLL